METNAYTEECTLEGEIFKVIFYGPPPREGAGFEAVVFCLTKDWVAHARMYQRFDPMQLAACWGCDETLAQAVSQWVFETFTRICYVETI